MVRLTDTLAVETKAYNIQIFAIRPGWVCTAMSEGVLQSEGRTALVPPRTHTVGTGRGRAARAHRPTRGFPGGGAR